MPEEEKGQSETIEEERSSAQEEEEAQPFQESNEFSLTGSDLIEKSSENQETTGDSKQLGPKRRTRLALWSSPEFMETLNIRLNTLPVRRRMG